MARIRSLHPSLLEAIQNLSLPGQLLVERLPLACDDCGRQIHKIDVLGLALFPGQSFSPEQITEWLDELEKAGWIERYTVDGVAYLRMLEWRRWQKVNRPTPSRLPASPTERLKNFINLEATRILQGREPKDEMDQELEDDSETHESICASDAEDIDHKSIVRDFRRIQRSAERGKKHEAAMKAVYGKAKFAGVHPAAAKATAVDPVPSETTNGAENAAAGEGGEADSEASPPRRPPPHEMHGLPAANHQG